jgi:prenylcysteine oxidase / farnesylcysteine lyase
MQKHKDLNTKFVIERTDCLSVFHKKVITRINYGQSVAMSGLAGAVALAGSNADLWAIKGGNWLLAKGLLELTNPTLHLDEGIESISDNCDHYVLTSDKGKEYECDVTVIATPLDEVNITFMPPVSVPYRRMQHTYTTFVRGLLNPVSAYASLVFSNDYCNS